METKQVFSADDLNLTAVGYDYETNGLFPSVSWVHSICVMDLQGNYLSCAQLADGSTPEGLSSMSEGLRAIRLAKIRVAHNAIDYDEKITEEFFPADAAAMVGEVLDTLIMSQYSYPDIQKSGPNNGRLPQFLRSQHSLKAWGYRLGENKTEYTGGFEEWNWDMQLYMVQDCVVLIKLFRHLMAQKPNQRSLRMEHDFAKLMSIQQARGFTFDMEGALVLHNKLTDAQVRLTAELQQEFGEWWAVKKQCANQDKRDGVVWPQATRSRTLKEFPDITRPRYSEKTGKRLADYVGPPKETVTEGCPYTPIYRHTFNPGSRADCIHVLKTQYGWKPVKQTESGLDALDEEVLLELEEQIPEAKKILDYFTLQKRLGQVSAGRNAWITKARQRPNGEWAIHGRVKSLGTVTTRCSHSDPNMGQVPALRALYGPECRRLFRAGKDFVLIGSDADSAQLRGLAHYLYPFDGGELARAVHEGNKEQGTDAHSVFARDVVGHDILGLNLKPGETARDRAKTLRYARMFGAGFRKQGITAQPWLSDEKAIQLGREIESRIAMNASGEAALVEKLTEYASMTGTIQALDGRILPVRSSRNALSSLLQSAEAIVMKKVLVHHKAQLEARDNIILGRDYHYVANVHDEFECEVLPEVLDRFTATTLSAYVEVGEQLKLRCPFVGTVDVGQTWEDVH
jgi:DNA polymerase I